MRLSHLPLRLATGAFLLNDGLSKRSLATEAASGLDGVATPAFPQAPDLSPGTLGRALTVGEVAVGAMLLTPFISPVVAGAALTAFSGAVLRMWWVTPGMHAEGSPRPSQEGTSKAKDVWLLGSGLALVLDGVGDSARDTARRTRKSARRTTKAARAALPVG
jgi:uncharacterized membrane protein YphA (DoxX/SURF4 family)